MPRNGSGTYSLPAGNPVVAGTTIEASWANTTLTDIGSAVTDSLSRNGEGAMLSALRIVDGTVSAPGMAFSAETGSGFYRTGTTTVRLAIGGVYTMEFGSSGVTVPSGKSLTVAGTFALTGDQVQVSEGGTGATDAAGARTNLGGTTVGANFFTLSNPSAVTFIRVNADNTVSALDAATFRTAIGAGSGTGDVVGPASATNNAIVLFDGTTGKLIKNSSSVLPTGAIVGTTDTQTLSAKTLTTPIVNGYTEGVVTANTSTAYTIDISTAGVQILTLTGNCVYTFPTATAGKSFILIQKQDATGSRTVTWPASVKWPGGTAPTITATASKADKYIFTADGTNWIGSNAGQNYTV